MVTPFKNLILLLFILQLATTSYAQTYTVERVIDGDTIVVTTPEGKSEEVQLIGIKAPEDEKMGQEATEYVKMLIVHEKMVRLEFDVQERDKYGRLLAYVFTDVTGLLFFPIPKEALTGNPDGKEYLFINAYIIGNGYATPMTIPPNEEALGEARTVSDGAAHHNIKYAELFKELYEEAKEQKRGLWSEGSCSEKVTFEGLCKKMSYGYFYDSSIGKCRKVKGQCRVKTPFETLEECQEECEEE